MLIIVFTKSAAIALSKKFSVQLEKFILYPWTPQNISVGIIGGGIGGFALALALQVTLPPNVSVFLWRASHRSLYPPRASHNCFE